MGKLQVKRIYEAPEETDGSRVLVDRLWPRGIKKEKAELTAWEKTIAPTNELRKAFGHDPEKFPAFAQKYTDELENNPESEPFLEKIKIVPGCWQRDAPLRGQRSGTQQCGGPERLDRKKECCAMSAALFLYGWISLPRPPGSTVRWSGRDPDGRCPGRGSCPAALFYDGSRWAGLPALSTGARSSSGAGRWYPGGRR